MFASLKSKIKEETGSDLSKLASSWKAGNFLGRIALKDDSSTPTPTSSGGFGDSTSESISPQLESYLSDRTGGQVDQVALQQHYTSQLEAKLKDRDAMWERKMQELTLSQSSVQSEEAAAAQAVARAAQSEAAKCAAERDVALKQLRDIKERLASVERAHDRLDAVTEELEESRRQWSRERAELAAALSAAEARARDAADDLQLVRAAVPPDSEHHRMDDGDKRELHTSGCADYDKLCRERAVLSRQLQEAKMALADVKTSWSGQIASLETQVARLSRQAGEEGVERRRVENEKRELQEKMMDLTAELERTKQNLANSEAKVVRVTGEARSLSLEVRSLRAAADHSAEKAMAAEKQLSEALQEIEDLRISLENERTLVRILQEKVEKSSRMYDERTAEVQRQTQIIQDLQKDCRDMQRMFDRERCEKDDALLRNATMSQSMEMSQTNLRYQEAETVELQTRIVDLEKKLAQHTENQAACMLIKENEESRTKEIDDLKKRIEDLSDSEKVLRNTIQDLETDICDKNKKIKTLDSRILDMKKTLQRELQQSNKSDLTSAEEQDISRRYLKHVVLRFLTAREIEARQLTRALSVLLRLNSHEEAMLRAALPRHSMGSWFPSLGNT